MSILFKILLKILYFLKIIKINNKFYKTLKNLLILKIKNKDLLIFSFT